MQRGWSPAKAGSPVVRVLMVPLWCSPVRQVSPFPGHHQPWGEPWAGLSPVCMCWAGLGDIADIASSEKPRVQWSFSFSGWKTEELKQLKLWVASKPIWRNYWTCIRADNVCSIHDSCNLGSSFPLWCGLNSFDSLSFILFHPFCSICKQNQGS